MIKKQPLMQHVLKNEDYDDAVTLDDDHHDDHDHDHNNFDDRKKNF